MHVGTAEELQAAFNPEVPPPLVPAHDPSDDEYFLDAVFIGDSMLDYLEILGLIPTAEYVWKIGLSPSNARLRQFRVKGISDALSAYEMAACYHPKKVYIWLGANGLDSKDENRVIDDYEWLANELIRCFPESLIYVISPPPMTESRMNRVSLSPARYSNFEVKLRDLAQRRRFYYIDLYHLVTNDNGYLYLEYTRGDGYHLSESAHNLLVDAVRRQTVPMSPIEPATGLSGSEIPTL